MTCVDDDLCGTELGPYSLGGSLGRGGMSTVYRAVDNRTRQLKACKVMSSRASADPGLQARFAGRACVVDHPNVVPIHEIGEADGRLFVGMALIEGVDLQTALRSGPLHPQRALLIFAQLCSALAALHQRGFLHMDVKPANLLLSAAHPTDHIFLLDYGLINAGQQLPAESFVGTPNYASPEHLRGQSIGPFSDVYSLTCVLFALLAGRPPFAGRLTEVIAGHLRGRAPSLATVSGLPSRIDRVIAAGLSADPRRRPADPEALSAAAAHALAGC